MKNIDRVRTLNVLQSNKVAEIIGRSGALFIELPEHGDGPVKVFDHDGFKIGEITLAQVFEL